VNGFTPLRENLEGNERRPIENIEAEQALLGGVLRDNSTYQGASHIIDAADFSSPVHGRIWSATRKLICAGREANPVILKNQFDRDDALEALGGGQYLDQLAKSAVTTHNVPYYAMHIRDLKVRRVAIAENQTFLDDLYRVDLNRPVGRILEEHAARVAELTHKTEGGAALICSAAAPHSITSIPPRRWAYGNFLLFGEASVIGGVDGVGKGAMAVVVALSFITGRALLGERVWRTGPIAIITYEDNEVEWRRRIAAACLHYGIDYEGVISNFYFITRPKRRISLAAHGPGGDILLPDGDDIIQALKGIGAVLLIVDPFNHAHELSDGNNNALIAQVAGEITRIARESDAAALVLHHLRKGSTGDPDDLMGATSLRATFRACRILARMTEKEAEALSVPARQSFRYSRIAGTTENYAPPPERATWYRLESKALGNPDELYTDGDNLQVTTSWPPPSAFAGIPLTEIAEIFTRLRLPPGEGLRWSPDKRTKDEWCGNPIVEVTGVNAEVAARMIKGWIDTATLIEDEYRHPKSRQMRKFVTLNEVKAAEILGLLYTKTEE
jgi:AAA domain/DnaB-like helicase N terminal domain